MITWSQFGLPGYSILKSLWTRQCTVKYRVHRLQHSPNCDHVITSGILGTKCTKNEKKLHTQWIKDRFKSSKSNVKFQMTTWSQFGLCCIPIPKKPKLKTWLIKRNQFWDGCSRWQVYISLPILKKPGFKDLTLSSRESAVFEMGARHGKSIHLSTYT